MGYLLTIMSEARSTKLDTCQGYDCVDCRPKKAVEGLLRHLQKKWEKVTARLGSGYELHLVGLLSGQQDTCLSWKSQGISTFLTVCPSIPNTVGM